MNDLPQEVIDLVFEFYHEQRHFSLVHEKEYTDRGKRHEFRTKIRETTLDYDKPLNWSWNKKFFASSQRAYNLVPYSLSVPHDYKKGLTALQVISSNGVEYNIFRAKVTRILLGHLDGRTRFTSSSLKHAYKLIAAKFPNLEEATVHYRSLRQVYQCYDNFSLTSEWEALDFMKHREGGYDAELMYPVRILHVADLAAALAERNKGHLRTYLDHCCVWNAKGRGVYHWQVCIHSCTLLCPGGKANECFRISNTSSPHRMSLLSRGQSATIATTRTAPESQTQAKQALISSFVAPSLSLSPS